MDSGRQVTKNSCHSQLLTSRTKAALTLAQKVYRLQDARIEVRQKSIRLLRKMRVPLKKT